MTNKQKVEQIEFLKSVQAENLEAVHTQCACSAFNI